MASSNSAMLDLVIESLVSTEIGAKIGECGATYHFGIPITGAKQQGFPCLCRWFYPMNLVEICPIRDIWRWLGSCAMWRYIFYVGNNHHFMTLLLVPGPYLYMATGCPLYLWLYSRHAYKRMGYEAAIANSIGKRDPFTCQIGTVGFVWFYGVPLDDYSISGHATACFVRLWCYWCIEFTQSSYKLKHISKT